MALPTPGKLAVVAGGACGLCAQRLQLAAVSSSGKVCSVDRRSSFGLPLLTTLQQVHCQSTTFQRWLAELVAAAGEVDSRLMSCLVIENC